MIKFCFEVEKIDRYVISSVSDPDPDPDPHFNADPDPDPRVKKNS